MQRVPLDRTEEIADIAANRSARKYSRREQVLRVLWSVVGSPLTRLSPRPCFGWRRSVLRAFGARVGRNVHVYPGARIYMPWNLQVDDLAAIGDYAIIYNLGAVRIGRRATISYRAHVCAGTHDFSRPDLPLLKPPIAIEDDAWVGTDAFIGPGVTVGKGAIVGARAVVMNDVGQFEVVAGNPARTIGTRTAKGIIRS